jgi:hypothetical protein
MTDINVNVTQQVINVQVTQYNTLVTPTVISSVVNVQATTKYGIAVAFSQKQGPVGPPGNTILYGAIDPTTEGIDGNFYINTATNFFFGPKALDVWPSGISLVGPQGIQGIQGNDGPQGPQGIQGIQGPAGTNGTNGTNGSDGADGADGVDGNTILYGTVNPTTEGVNGNFYINTSSNYFFGPKAAGIWPAGISLVGPQGIQGPAGTNGTNGTNGQGVPSGGSTGQLLRKKTNADYDTEWFTDDYATQTDLDNLALTNRLNSYIFGGL